MLARQPIGEAGKTSAAREAQAGTRITTMTQTEFLRRTVVLLAAATALAGVAAPAWPQAASPIAQPAAAVAPKCTVVPEQARLDFPLARVATQLATGRPIRIVA